MNAAHKNEDLALAVSGPGVIITENSLKILTEEGFQRVGNALARMDEIGPWLWGDYLLFAEKNNLRTVLDAARADLHRNRIREYIETARLFAPEDRDPRVSFSHHNAIDYFLGDNADVQEAKRWLKKAGDKGWTVGELREAMRLDSRKEERDPGPMRDTIHFADFIKVSRWTETVRPSDLAPEKAEDLRKTTTPLFNFLCELHRKPFGIS